MEKLIDGQPAGLDLVSLTSAYAKIHTKLVRSYTLEALLESRQQTPAAETVAGQARQFLEEIAAVEDRQFPAIGYGADNRFKGKGLAGAALVHANEVIHAAFFRLDEADPSARMASYRNRRRPFTE